MNILQTEDINTIVDLHRRIFNFDFPIDSYIKKASKSRIYMYLYEDKQKYLGYSIIIDQESEKNLYAWYGGVIPNNQGRGITNLFFDFLIDLAKKKDYCSISLATTNLRPHMITLAIKRGFNIYDIKKRDNTFENKIYFVYNITPEKSESFRLKQNKVDMSIPELEEQLVRVYKQNCSNFIFEKGSRLYAVKYALTYINSFYVLPEVTIMAKFSEKSKKDLKKIYKGHINLA